MAACMLALSGAATLAQPVGIATGPQGTMTFAAGAAISKVLLDSAATQSRLQPLSGSVGILPLVNSGEADFGFANTLELHDGFRGVGTFDKRPNPNLRVVAVLFPIRVGLIVRASSGIRSIRDLKGKSIAYGFAGQEGIKRTMDALLATAGLSVADLRPVLVPNVIRGMEEFVAGRVDVTTFILGSAKVAEAAAAVGGVRYLPIEDTAATRTVLKREYPTAYLATVAPTPEFVGVAEPTVMMMYDYVLIAGADVSSERVRTMVRALVERRGQLSLTMPAFRDLDPARIHVKFDVPYHGAAVDYFRSNGIHALE